jgi:intracellular sulfur oxidation DsrE/DsrF family protein
MSTKDQFSDEQLNAFVDGELDPEEKSRIYESARSDPDLDHRLCQTRKIKELVTFAYEDAPKLVPRSPSSRRRGGLLGRALAAGLLIIVGLAAGLAGHSALDRGWGQAAAVVEPGNFLIHVASGEVADMAAALQRAEYLLASAPDDGVRQVEIIANERGLDLLRSDTTQFADEISALQARDVVFYACSRTIQRLEERGVEVRLVPHTVAHSTALDQLVRRMQEGWHYEKI